MIETVKMIRDGCLKDTTISRVCAFCDTYEYPKADVGNHAEFLVCERCKTKLKAVLEREADNG